MISSWQKRRSEFNHDWLKNRYLNRLDAFLERLKISEPNAARLLRFVEEDFPEWKTRRSEARTLLLSFEKEMSPKSLFEQAPLKRCDDETRCWLGELVHALWMARYPVQEWVHKGEAALEAADRQYDMLVQSLNSGGKDPAAGLASLFSRFLEFRNACEKLGRAISALPSEVLVT